MRVGDIMKSPAITVAPHEEASAAWERMRALGIRHLVVVDGRRLIGVLAKHDLSGPYGGGSRRLGRHVVDLMHRNPPVVTRSTSVRRAAILLRNSDAGCLAVVEHGRVIGVVTVSDLLRLVE
jgi:acetoin utilization protein AcuB